jgi:hypothetical protein
MKSKWQMDAYRYQIYRTLDNKYEYPNVHNVCIRGLKN